MSMIQRFEVASHSDNHTHTTLPTILHLKAGSNNTYK